MIPKGYVRFPCGQGYMPDPHSNQSLRRRLNLLKGVYTPLKEALRLYSTTIEQSDALQPKN